MDNIIILLAVLLGFYLGRFRQVNKKAGKVIQSVKKIVKERKEKKGSLVVVTDEVALERAQEREDLNKGETIDVKEVVK